MKFFSLLLLMNFLFLPKALFSQSGVYKNNTLVKLENLMGSSKEGCEPTPVTYTGTVVKTIYPTNGGSDVMGIVLADRAGNRVSLYFSPGIESDLCNADRSWLRKLVRNGSKLKIVTYACGNGGIPSIDVLIPIR